MIFELSELFLIGLGYLLLLFGIAYLSEKGWIPERLVNHPFVYVLSLGVYAGAWAFFGTIDLAYQYGYGFLTYYIGTASLFLFAPLVLVPLLRICRAYQLSSLADLLTFRYRSQSAGILVTITMLIAVLPLLALQIQAVSEAAHLLSGERLTLFSKNTQPTGLALIFCLLIMLFTLLFGARQVSEQGRHNGLIAAIAFDSLVKLFCLFIVGWVAVYGVFGGFNGLDEWLQNHSIYLHRLHSPIQTSGSRTLLLIFFSAALALPHMFHIVFAETPHPRALKPASWGFPLYLLFLSLPVLPILWAGIDLQIQVSPQYYSLMLGPALDSPLLTAIGFIGGLSAASGTIIVITLALASMCLNHLVLPFYQPGNNQDIYRWLLWARRILIVTIISAGYLFFYLLKDGDLTGLGFAAFSATLQFLPGVLAVLYWPPANRIGFLSGLVCGYSIWFITLLLPILSETPPQYVATISTLLGAHPDSYWNLVALFSLAANILVFGFVSFIKEPSKEESNAAELCSQDSLNRPMREELAIHSPTEMQEQLAKTLGKATADREVQKALTALNLDSNEGRPYALRRLRDRIEANLSGLFGPSLAMDLVNRHLPYITDDQHAREDIYLIESRLEKYQNNLTGLAAELDSLRRFHRQTLQNLPIGVCSLGNDRELLMWNNAMEQLTGISSEDIIGSRLDSLPQPWQSLLSDFANEPAAHLHKQKIEDASQARWISLHKTSLDKTALNNQNPKQDGQIILLEDLTENQFLEDELIHSERLASIGRLAAGVAHEIGNPITGIACLAQNLHYDTEDPIIHETGKEILAQTKRVTRIVQSLVNFSHSGSHLQEQMAEQVSITSCAEEAINLLSLNQDSKNVNFNNLIDPHHYIIGDAQRILQVFINLLGNARDASPEGSTITLQSHQEEFSIIFTITDQGSGINKEVQEKIFEPFFTTKEPGQGTGLGLALVHNIIEDHNGHISIESPVSGSPSEQERRQGTRFSIKLPRYEEHEQGDI